MKNIIRFCVAALIFSTVFCPLSRGQSRDVPAPKLGSTFFNLKNLVEEPTAVGERRDVADLPTEKLDKFECHNSTLNPGLPSHPPHRHPQEELIILRSGELEVVINGAKQRIGAGSLFFFASYDLPCVENVGKIPATYNVVNYATALTHTIPAKPAAESAQSDQLRSAVFDWKNLIVSPTPTSLRRPVLDSPTVTADRLHCDILRLNLGSGEDPAFANRDEDVVYIVREGSQETTVKGLVQSAGAGTVIYSAASEARTLKAVGKSAATYYALAITPPGAQRTSIER